MPITVFSLAEAADGAEEPVQKRTLPNHSSDIMEKVRCPDHGSLCLLKTGTREGPNKGRSFYVCPAHHGTACPYTRPVNLPASHCLLHDDSQLDLQALVKQDSRGYRLYYRCIKSDGKKFCGSVPWKEESKCKVMPRCDLPVEKMEKPQRNPFKVIEGPRPAAWRQAMEERKRSSEESGEEKTDGIQKSSEEKTDGIQRNSGEEETNGIQRNSGEKKTDGIQKKSGEEKTDGIQKKSGEEKTDGIQRKSGEEKSNGNQKSSEEKNDGMQRKSNEKTDCIQKKMIEEKTGNQRKSGEEKTDGVQKKRIEEALNQDRGKNRSDDRTRGVEDKSSNQELKSSKEVRPQNKLIIEADNREKTGRTSEGRAAIVENTGRTSEGRAAIVENTGRTSEGRAAIVENTGRTSEGRAAIVEKTGRTSEGRVAIVEKTFGGQIAVRDCEEPASFSGWRDKELPAGLKIKKKLPEEMVQKAREASPAVPESSVAPSIKRSGPDQKPVEDNDDVVFVSSQPGKDKVSALRTSGGGKQRTITSFPGFTPPAEAQGSVALHASLSAQLQQKKATLASVNLKVLPDGGERLRKQVQDLEDALGCLSLSTEAVTQSVKDQDPGGKVQPEPRNPSSRTGPPEGRGGVKPLSFHELPPQSSLGLQGSTPSLSQNYSSLYSVTPQWQSLYGGRMTEERLFAVRNATSDAIDHLHKSLDSCPGPESTADDPRGLKVPLLLHQKQALAWLQWREAQLPQGGILADDMGLGKTLTMIALILAQKQRQKSEKEEEKKLESWISKTDSTLMVSRGTLIICPASLIHHWKKEVERRVCDGRLRVYLYHGANREKDCKMLAQYDIVVTTYSLVSKEIPAKKEEGDAPAQDQDLEERAASSPLLRLAWARIILDEAHNIKNPKVQTSIAVCKLRAGARWAVTGTPIQNNLLDLYSLLRFLRCSPFDEYKLWKSQVDNGSRKGGERLTILTKSLLLRRTKDQMDHTGRPLVELPQRRSELHQLTLSAQEQAVYDVIFARSRSTLQNYLKRHEGGLAGSHAASGGADNPFDRVAREFGPSQGDISAPPASHGSSTVHILSLLLRLRQCCGHLSLLKTTLDQLELKNEGLSLTLEEQLNALTLCDLQSPDPKSTVSLNGTNFQAELFQSENGSTKIDALMSQLRTISFGALPQKSVVVSQWTSMLKIVAVHLKQMGISYATIDGSINPKLRMDVVEDFNNDPRGPQVMLVSLCAGGVGLNLIGGNHLFLMDMHWNPALEDQACDRIYRVGQRKDVVIHRFVCQGTVEEKITQLQEKKKDLAKKVLTGNSSTVTKLTLSDLRLLFGV
ncbi:transcription termination factor 2 [Hyla sarda]|uniref:transcription termination factor 2 n=1 Tax=Hyla sarda TaxID=327740 RepID=UPI0024C346BB|nr:transcription termination factor 2 [Hyla sarda]